MFLIETEIAVILKYGFISFEFLINNVKFLIAKIFVSCSNKTDDKPVNAGYSFYVLINV